MKLTLTEKRPETADAMTFIFQPDQPVTWQAGQFLQYNFPHSPVDDRGIKRWFTIAAAPFEKHIQITTRLSQKGSSFKQHLAAMKPGDTIEAGQPEGDFVVTDPAKAFIFIAGGIGITPFRSILKQADHDGIKLDVELLYGNRDQASSVFAGELAELAANNPKLKIHNIYEPDRIDAKTIQGLPDYRGKTFYISGPEPMVEAFEKLLAGIGIPEEQQQRDYFPGYEWKAV